ncbi:MAG: PGPGW domain-containing protein [Calditrichaeota bacterium]|nr:PGPGW domain-containing protein [Calditrichota bacterium]MCB9391772.1 PGPGW domain-containing protein [Calditrichota bacterium]
MNEQKRENGRAFRTALRWFRTLIGFTVLLIGVLLIVLPGPAVVVIPVGLGILATEYAWARKYLKKFKDGGEKLGMLFFSKRKKSADSA